MSTIKYVPPPKAVVTGRKIVADSTKQLKKYVNQTFEIRKKGKTVKRHTLLVNPQEMSFEEPSRSNPVQTLGGAYIQDFGPALQTVNISGVTGYRLRKNYDNVMRDGYQEYKALRNDMYRYFINYMDADMAMYWFNWEDDEYYQVIPTNFRLQRSRSEPLMYRYDLSMTILKDARSLAKSKPPNFNDPLFNYGGNFGNSVGTRMMGSLSSLNETISKLR